MSRDAAEGALICTAADAEYFALLRGLVLSLKASGFARHLPIGVLDLGLTEAQRGWLAGQGARCVEPGWDVDIPWPVPGHYRAMAARPHLPRYFPGFGTYLWLDGDTWVQDGAVLGDFLRAAGRGLLAIVPELDRGYWTAYKPPKLWGQNQKAFAWSYGLRAGYRLGRNPILNVGAFALRGDAPHWALWAEAHRAAIRRFRLGGRSAANFFFQLSEQTAMNYVCFKLRQPFTLLPATANWFCGKGTPAWCAERRMVVEPHAPHTPLGIVHLAGKGMKDRLWRLPVIQGGEIETLLTWDAVAPLQQASERGAA
jgi:hypothetical protein